MKKRVLASGAMKRVLPIAFALAAFGPESETLAQHRRAHREGLQAMLSPLNCRDSEVIHPDIHTEVVLGVVSFRVIERDVCNAASNTHFEYSRHGSDIRISEVFVGIPTSCLCPFEFSGSITNLPSGQYNITFEHKSVSGRYRSSWVTGASGVEVP